MTSLKPGEFGSSGQWVPLEYAGDRGWVWSIPYPWIHRPVFL